MGHLNEPSISTGGVRCIKTCYHSILEHAGLPRSRTDRLREIRALVGKELSARERQIFIMRYTDRLTMAEIAAVLGIPEPEVRDTHWSILGRIRQRLAV